MKNNMVECNSMGEKHDFIEYQHANQVVKDFPGLLIILNKLIPVLYDKSHYTAVYSLLQSAEDSKMILEMQYSYYKQIYDKKGKVNE